MNSAGQLTRVTLLQDYGGGVPKFRLRECLVITMKDERTNHKEMALFQKVKHRA